MYLLEYWYKIHIVAWLQHTKLRIHSLEYWYILLLIYSYAGINCVIKWTFQRRRCWAFDSPGLPNDSAGYPGLTYVVWETTPSVLRSLSVIRHKSPRCNHALTEKAQHLRRWISLRTFTRGRLVPRQPRAIKRTTRTELHRYNIHPGRCVHRNTGITLTALHGCNIYKDECIH